MARFKYAIIDLDIVLYVSAAIAQKTVYHLYNADGDFIQTFESAKDCKNYLKDAEDFFDIDTTGYERKSELRVGEFEEAVKAFDHLIKKYIKGADAEMGWFSIGGSDGNFRDDIAVEKKYKGNREGTEKPVHHAALKQYAISTLQPHVASRIESDDLISIRLYQDTQRVKRLKDKSKAECVLVVLEKDAYNSVGHIYIPDTGEIKWNSTLQANKWVAYQAMVGDSADNYGAIPKVGPKKAEKLLVDVKSTKDCMEVVCTAYKAHYGTEPIQTKDWQGNDVTRFWHDFMVENVRLAYMLRENDTENEWKKLFKGVDGVDEWL